MKIALLYYSATGNTKLACEHLQNKIPEIELIDISRKQTINIEEFDIVGIASPVFYLGIPAVMSSFINAITTTNDKPAFLLVTYGMMPGKAIKILGNWLREKKFQVFEYFMLRMPESFPPYITKGWSDANAPNKEEIQSWNEYIDALKYAINQIKLGKKIKTKNIKIGFFNSIIPASSKKKNLKKFGTLLVNEQNCISCGKCKDACVYQAISYTEKPSFDMSKCNACFSCFNACPQKAIVTTLVPSSAQYHGPANILEEKFL